MDEKSETDQRRRMIEVIMKTARRDYSGRIDSTGGNNAIDAFAEVINRMVGEVRERITECRTMENACLEITSGERSFPGL